MTAFYHYTIVNRPKFRKENPTFDFHEVLAVNSKGWKSLDRSEMARYDTMARVDKERYHREKAEWEKRIDQKFQELWHPSATNKDNNRDRKQESQPSRKIKVRTGMFTPVELNVLSVDLIQGQLYSWYVELSQAHLYASALKCVLGVAKEPEITGVPSSTIPITQYGTLPQDMQSQIRKHQKEMVEWQEEWNYYFYLENDNAPPTFVTKVTKHVIDEFCGLEVYQIKDVYPRTWSYNAGEWMQGHCDIEVFDAQSGKRLFYRLGTVKTFEHHYELR